jgi:hypothetical protein
MTVPAVRGLLSLSRTVPVPMHGFQIENLERRKKAEFVKWIDYFKNCFLKLANHTLLVSLL